MGKKMELLSLDKEKTAFFTAHRFNYIPKLRLPAIEKECRSFLRDAIDSAIYNDYDTFLNGGALGGDTWAAEEVLDMKKKYPHIKLIICEPYWGRYMTWSQDNQERYLRICRAANSIVTVNNEPYERWKMHARNNWMVDRSTLGIALLRSDVREGGTFNCTTYARRKKILMDIFDPLPLIEDLVEVNADQVRCVNYDRVEY